MSAHVLVPEGYDALDAHGCLVRVRPVTGGDVPQLTALCHHLSPRSRYQRFLGTSPVVADGYLTHLLTGEATLDAVVVVKSGQVVGVGSTHPMTAQRAELALVVDDAVQAAGIGTLLAEDLVARSLVRGVRQLCAEVLRTNAQVLDLLQHLGPSTVPRAEADSLSIHVALRDLAGYRRAVAQRDLSSRARSVTTRPARRPGLPAPPLALAHGTGYLLPDTRRALALQQSLRLNGLDLALVVPAGKPRLLTAPDVVAAAAGGTGPRVAVVEASSVTDPSALARVHAACGAALVVLLDPLGADAEQVTRWCRCHGIRTADSLAEAGRVAAGAARARHTDRADHVGRGPDARTRGVLRQADLGRAGWMTYPEAAALLRAYDVPHVPVIVVDDADTAVEATSLLRLPVTVTACRPDGTPDPEPLTVRDVPSAEQLRAAVVRLEDSGERLAFAVQSQPVSDLDLRLSLHRHGRWGVTAELCTLGGTRAEDASHAVVCLPAKTAEVVASVRAVCPSAHSEEARAARTLTHHLPELLERLSELLEDRRDVLALELELASTPSGRLWASSLTALTDGSDPAEAAILREVRRL